MKQISGNIVNLFDSEIYSGTVFIENKKIAKIEKLGPENLKSNYLLPGFIDSHVHVESSLLAPSEFGKMACVHGTVATISDPHEIANVVGKAGVYFMIENGEKIPFKFFFGAPSCVPATQFETAGAEINPDDVEELLKDERILYLAEMMNFPGVIFEEKEAIKKLDLAKKYSKVIDGHAPGLRGEQAEKYFAKGISTDHECFTEEEAADKIQLGVKILIREGSAARNFDALIPLAIENSSQMMFCSDDKHPDELSLGHINQLVKRAIEQGVNIFDALRMASLNPVLHYKLPVGLLRKGDFADFIEVDNLDNFKVLATYIDGQKVAENGKSLIKSVDITAINNFEAALLNSSDLEIDFQDSSNQIRVIKMIDGQLVTGNLAYPIEKVQEKNISKIVVYNRYKPSKPAVAFIEGFNLENGALASSVAHDSHNIVAVGTSDADIVRAINLVIEEKGGLSAVCAKEGRILPLDIAGLMSSGKGEDVAEKYTEIDRFVKEEISCSLRAPFMSLSFMALLVIPSLKLSDKGLFDGDKFEFVSVDF